MKAGFNLANFSASVFLFGYSSVSNVISPFLLGIITGTISSLNLPESTAAMAFFWDSNAKASCSSLVIPYFSAIFSAVIPIWILW